ncbi:helix-turn-helix domain-containing protein [Companilactobacillus sp. HBUAS56275]|uniref:Helix-turn-helix domain-containing protein n=1 Tax=Candidatus Companilactobacillus pullicola TaxID=2838523 RepID=A0A9D1ZP55_9LACO|nr:helix-turn-helix domain-containing protein [Candidatus Companilactobacillus pullicola]
MELAKNIVKYRKRNKLSQEQLAEALNISRQSISKWETGENLPSIDNLISLSGLLDISLDELITGEPYLHFPFDYGKPKNRWPQVILVLVMVLVATIITILFGKTPLIATFDIILGILISYFFMTRMGFYDYKRYCDYWTLEKSGISYSIDDEDEISFGKDFIMPLLGLLNIRSTKFISYKQIKSVEIYLKLYEYDPSKELTLMGGSGISASSMVEQFELRITLLDGKRVNLNLNQYYWKDSKERKMLGTIVTFLKRKHFEFIDKQGIADLLRDDEGSLTRELYKQRDDKQKER